jgi:hypothetical protein
VLSLIDNLKEGAQGIFKKKALIDADRALFKDQVIRRGKAYQDFID